MIGTVLRKFFWNTFDHLGTLVLLNLVWFVISLPWFVGGYFGLRLLVHAFGAAGSLTGTVAWVIAVWLSPASLWVVSIVTTWAGYHTLSRREAWVLLGRRVGLGVLLSVAGYSVAVVIGVNGAFYLRFEGILHWPGLVLAGVMVWGLLALLATSFHLSHVIAQASSNRLRHVLKRSFLLALRFPLPTAAMGIVTLSSAVALAVTQVGLPLLAMALPAMFCATWHREQMKRALPPEERDEEADRNEEVRTLRDLIKPWDMER